MASLMLLTLILSMVAYSSATWCVCKDGVSDTMLQRTLDYACGAGADCTTTHSNGPCYNPNTVRAHCNYAVNSYFQKKGQAQGSCDFSGTASVTTSDPSSSGCVYPASASAVTTSPVTTTTPSSTTPSSTTPSSTTPSSTTTMPGTAGGTSTTTPVGNSPYSTTPTGFLSPPGSDINTDVSDGGNIPLGRISILAFLIAFLISGLMF